MKGGHLVRLWSETHATVAQSSAENERLGAVAVGAPWLQEKEA